MPRLPQPGGDAGNWGQILNDYLSVEHNADGSFKNAARPSDVASKYTKPGSGIPKTDLEQPVRDTLDTVTTHTTELADHATTLTQHTTDISAKANQTSVNAITTRIDGALKADGTLKDTVVTRAALDASVAAAVTSIPLGNTVAFMGDSITANPGPGKVDGAYRNWAVLLPDGAVTYGGAFATGGYTAQQVRDVHLPQVLALNPKPTMCVVLAGTNNASSDLAGARQALTDIYTGLRAAGIVPIACALTPRSDAVEFVARLNRWIAQYARLNTIPFCNFHNAKTVDAATGGWKSGLNLDTVHPGVLGAKAMGETLAPVLKTVAASRPWSPALAASNVDVTVAFASPLFTGFTANGEGFPPTQSGGVAGARRGLQFAGGAANCTVATEVDAANVNGAWLKLTASGSGGFNIRQLLGGYVTANPGDVWFFGLKIWLSGMGADNTVSVGLVDGVAGSSLDPLNGGSGSTVMTSWTKDIGPVTVWGYGVVPAGKTSVRVDIAVTGSAGPVIRIGEVTPINLTALGIA